MVPICIAGIVEPQNLQKKLLFNRCMTLIVKVWEMHWPQTGATHYHTQLGLPVKGRAIKELLFALPKCIDQVSNRKLKIVLFLT